MEYKNVSFIFIFLAFLLVCEQGQAQSAPAVAGEYIIKFKSTVNGNAVQSKLNQKASLKSSLHLKGMYSIAISSGQQEAVKELAADPDVEFIEPNYILNKIEEETAGVHSQTLTWQEMTSLHTSQSDYQGSSFGLYDQTGAAVKANEAWNESSAYNVNNRPIVAVVDSGLDKNHYVFTQTQSVWVNTGEIASNGIDDDFNGYVDDVSGWNFVSNNSNFYDDEGHGTHVSGIVLGATMDILNTPPLSAAKIQIMPVKFLNSSGSGTTSAAISAIYYAVNNGAKVINCSWGGSAYSQALHQAMSYAYDQGVLVVSAAGNYKNNNDVVDMYPANYEVPSNISVAATNDSDTLASFSNFGPTRVHIASPGVLVYSTIRGGNSFGLMSGTSMAAPFVAGAAALAWREANQLLGYQIKTIILSTADTVTALANKVSTQSRINVLEALREAKTLSSAAGSQPNYSPQYKAERSPASSSSSSGGQSAAGCGLIASVLGKNNFKGPSSPDFPLIGIVLGLLLLPLAAWMALRRMDPRNQRKHDRFRMRSDIKVMVGNRELVGHMNTISTGGLCFSADEALEQGGIITMKIASPDGKELIEVQGHIVWSEENKAYGVQFDAAKEGILSSINGWTKSLTKI